MLVSSWKGKNIYDEPCGKFQALLRSQKNCIHIKSNKN